MKFLRPFVLSILLLVSAFLSFKIYQQEKNNQKLQSHKVAILDIKYGLFNVDEWKQIFSNLIAKKMNGFTIANTDEEMIKREIADFLETTISNFEKRYQEQNKGSGFANLLKRSVTSFAGIFDQVKDDIPIFTEEIYTFFTEGNSQEMLKKYIEGLMDTYTKDTYLATDYTVMISII